MASMPMELAEPNRLRADGPSGEENFTPGRSFPLALRDD